MEKYIFDKPLIEAIILNRKGQFICDIEINGKLEKAHCPTTNRIGNIKLKNIPCLVSYNDDPKRKLKYTIEAISCDELNDENKNWIGINQILSNKLVDFFIKTNQLSNMLPTNNEIKREVNLGVSKLDFLVDNTYLEVKTPLTDLNVIYSSNIQIVKQTPFSSTDRFTKHIKELASSLKNNERAILLVVYQYQITNMKPHTKSANYDLVKQEVDLAIQKGVEFWEISMKFNKDSIELISCNKHNIIS